VLAVVGENGSGKSTTMNVIAGVLELDCGAMSLAGEPFAPANRREAERAGVGFIQQELNIFPNLSVAENLFLGRAPRLMPALPLLSRRKRKEAARHWLSLVGLDVDPDMQAGRLRTGQRQLLEIARALSSEARLLIFDEPTSSLTVRESEHLFGLIETLRANGHAILFVSHNLKDVLAVADRILVLRNGRVTLDAANDNLGAAQLVSAMLGREVAAFFPHRAAPGVVEPLLVVSGLGASNLLADIRVTVGAGEIVGLAGLMGSGRSELARIIYGLDPHDEGTIHLSGHRLASGDLKQRRALGIGFLSEDRRNEGILAEASVADNIALAGLRRFRRSLGIIERQQLALAIRQAVAPLNLKSGGLDRTKISTLSGGNQQKALLARWLICRPRFMILDEPTRGVDVGAKQDIYQLIADLAANGSGVLVISSELEELMGIADRILVLRRGRISAEVPKSKFDRDALLGAAFGQPAAA